MPLVVICDSLRSAFNVGSIFRTSECVGVREIVLCGYWPSHPRMLEGAIYMGFVRFLKVVDVIGAIPVLKLRVVHLERSTCHAISGQRRNGSLGQQEVQREVVPRRARIYGS